MRFFGVPSGQTSGAVLTKFPIARFVSVLMIRFSFGVLFVVRCSLFQRSGFRVPGPPRGLGGRLQAPTRIDGVRDRDVVVAKPRELDSDLVFDGCGTRADIQLAPLNSAKTRLNPVQRDRIL